MGKHIVFGMWPIEINVTKKYFITLIFECLFVQLDQPKKVRFQINAVEVCGLLWI